MNGHANIYLNSDEINLVNKYRTDVISRQKYLLERKKLSHFKLPLLRSLLGPNQVVPDQLYLIKFRHYVSLYLYLYIISLSEPISESSPYSNLVRVNITKLSTQIECSRNTMKAAYKELLQLGLIMEINEFIGNKPKMCSVVNYDFIVGFEKNKGKVVFSISKI